MSFYSHAQPLSPLKKDRTGGRNLYGTGSQYRATVVGHCSSSGGRTECQHPKGFGPLQLFARRDGRLVECPGKSSLRFPKREQSRRYYWCPYRHPHALIDTRMNADSVIVDIQGYPATYARFRAATADDQWMLNFYNMDSRSKNTESVGK